MGQHNTIEIQFRLQPAARTVPRREPKVEAPAAGRLPRVTQVLALAIQFQEMIRLGEVEDCADLARLGGLTRERISQIMKLAWLAPDIQMELLYLPPDEGIRFPITERAVSQIAETFSWIEQRKQWAKIKELNHLS